MDSDYNTQENPNMISNQNPDPYSEWRELEEKRRGYCQYVRRLCSRLGFALCLLYLLIGVAGFIFVIFYRRLEAVLPTEEYASSLMSILSYTLALPAMLLFLKSTPEIRIEPKKMRLRKFLMFLVLVMGGGYIFNCIGAVINYMIAGLSGQSMEQLNPVTDVLNEMNWLMMVYMVLFAPVIEEFIFRKVILNRLRPLGEKAAILYSAIAFGLLHGNIAQFLYATVIGIVFGYMAVKTGRIVHTIVLHMIVNGYSVFIVTGLINALASRTDLRDAALGIISLIYIGLSAAAVAICLSKRKKVFLRRGSAPEGVEYQQYSGAMYLNPGTILFLCMMMYSMILMIIAK